MLEHLLIADPKDFISSADLPAVREVDARFNTAKLMEELGVPTEEQAEQAAARNAVSSAFQALTSQQTEGERKALLAKLDVPEAVKELVGMLTAYNWAFVEQAQELRGYAVAKLTEETVHPDARIRLKALELLGKVTEVALFTERSEVKRTGMDDKELDEELKKRLAQYTSAMRDVEGEVLDQEENKQ